MANIISLGVQSVDYDVAVEEIDLLVPKYLDSLEALKTRISCDNAKVLIGNVAVYWERIAFLFEQVKSLELTMDFDEVIQNSLQSELTVLEEVYFTVSTSSEESVIFTDAIECILSRMDFTLQEMDFKADHEDRELVKKLLADNHLRRGTMLKVKETA